MKRKPWQRAVSVLQPVKHYQCERGCGFSGMLSSRTGIEQRNRKLLAVLAWAMVLAGTAVLTTMLSEQLLITDQVVTE